MSAIKITYSVLINLKTNKQAVLQHTADYIQPVQPTFTSPQSTHAPETLWASSVLFHFAAQMSRIIFGSKNKSKSDRLSKGNLSGRTGEKFHFSKIIHDMFKRKAFWACHGARLISFLSCSLVGRVDSHFLKSQDLWLKGRSSCRCHIRFSSHTKNTQSRRL